MRSLPSCASCAATFPSARSAPSCSSRCNTVKTHARNIYRKLAVATRADAVSRARELELL